MRVHSLRRFWERWRWLVTAISAAHLAWLAFVAVTGITGAVLFGWALSRLSHVSWFWTTFGWAGVIGGAILAWLVISVGWVLLGLSVYFLRAAPRKISIPVSSAAHPTSTHTPVAEVINARTDPVDAPAKKGAIDRLLGILNDEMLPWIEQGNRLTNQWREAIVGRRTLEFGREALNWRDAHTAIADKIDGIGRDSRFKVYRDILALIERPYAKSFVPLMWKFAGNVNSLGDEPQLTQLQLDLFIGASAEETNRGIATVHKWRDDTEQRAIKLRQSLPSSAQRASANPPEPQYVSLQEAATRAYEETRGKDPALWAEAMAEGNHDQVITWFCWTLWKRLTIFGNHPPSRLSEPIDRTRRNRHTFKMRDQGLVLEELYGHGRFENLKVLASELPAALAEIGNIGNEFVSLPEVARLVYESLPQVAADPQIKQVIPRLRLEAMAHRLLNEGREHGTVGFQGVNPPGLVPTEIPRSDLLPANLVDTLDALHDGTENKAGVWNDVKARLYDVERYIARVLDKAEGTVAAANS